MSDYVVVHEIPRIDDYPLLRTDENFGLQDRIVFESFDKSLSPYEAHAMALFAIAAYVNGFWVCLHSATIFSINQRNNGALQTGTAYAVHSLAKRGLVEQFVYRGQLFFKPTRELVDMFNRSTWHWETFKA